MMAKFFRRFLGFFLWLTAALVFILLLIGLVFSVPEVQSRVASLVVSKLNERYDVNLQIESTRYQFPNLIRMRGVYAFGVPGDTLFFAPELKVKIGRFSQNSLRLNSVYLKEPRVKMILPTADSLNNWQVFISKFTPTNTDSVSDFRFEIGNFYCEAGSYQKYKEAEDTLQFHLKHGDIDISDFYYHAGEIGAYIQGLHLLGRRAELHDLQGSFFYKKDQGFALSQASIQTSKSNWRGSLYFDVKSNEDYLDFMNKVRLKFLVDDLKLNSEELRKYVPTFPRLGELMVNGTLEGTFMNLLGSDLSINYAGATSARADVHIINLLDLENLSLDLSLKYFSSTYNDFSYLMKELVNEDIGFAKNYFDRFTFSGLFKGTMNSFTANGALHTNEGTFDLAVDVRGNGKPLKQAKYRGELKGKRVNLGFYTGQKEMGLANFQISIDGKGLEASIFDAKIKGRIKDVEIQNYTFRNIDVDGDFRQQEFRGVFSVNDPNLKLAFEGSAHLGLEEMDFDFKATIDDANLVALGIVDNDDSIYSFAGEAFVLLDRNLKGDWVGEIRVSDVLVQRSERVYFFRDIILNSFERGGKNYVNIDSEMLRALAWGKFGLADLVRIVPNNLARYSSLHEADNLLATVQIEATTGDTRLLTDLLAPGWYIAPDTRIKGAFSASALELNVRSSLIQWNDQELRYMDLSMNEEQGQILTRMVVQEYRAGRLVFPTPVLKMNLFLDSLDFDFSALFSPQIGGDLQLKGSMVQVDEGAFDVHLQPVDWKIGEGAFRIMSGSTMRIKDKSIQISDFEVDSEGRKLIVNGGVSSSPYEILRVELENFYIDIFNFLWEGSGYEIMGELEGEIILGSLLDAPRFASNLRIDSLVINGNRLGNLFVDSEWYIYEQFVELDLHLDRGRLRTLEIEGRFYPDENDDPLDLVLRAQRFNIAPLTPLFTAFTDNIRGVTTGELKINGTFRSPKLNGALSLPNFGMSIPYLNTDYNFEGNPQVLFTTDSIRIPGARIRDNEEQTTGMLKANMAHQGFRDWNLNVNIEADRLLMLNTNLLLNDYYYGKAFVSGNVDIKGPTSDLVMLIDVKTNRGTQFFIPVDGPTEVNPMGFVDFVRYVDIEKKDTTLNLLTDQGGLSLQFNVDVTPEAEVIIIMDQRTGEAIRGNGRGNLRFTLDPLGNIALFGNLEINRGEYLFTLGGLVRKRFLIEPGGSITFNGDPYEAVLDLTSRYVTRTSLNGAVADPTIAAVRTEVNLLLNLYGPLLNPEIGFEIKLPNVAPGIAAEVADRFADPNRLTQQAFSLLALNSFYADDLGLDAQVGGGLANTTIDVFANQVNNFLSRYVKVVDIAINYTGEGVTGASQEEFEVAVSQRLFEDRVSINGVVGVPLGANQNQLAGDVEVEVMLTEDGRVRAKAFNRSYQNNLLIEQTGLYSQGVGLFYRTDFNRRRELLRKLFFVRGSGYRD